MLLADVEEVIALHIADRLAARERQNFALNLEDRLAVRELDTEAIAGEGENLFFQDQSLGLACGKLGEDANRLGNWCELGHICDLYWTQV